MAFLVDANFNVVAELDELQKAARVHNIDLSIHRVAKGEEIAAAIDAAKASGATALNFSASPLFFTHRQLIQDRVAALACRRSMNGLKRPRKAVLPPTDRASMMSF
jgi:hypothetical protein